MFHVYILKSLKDQNKYYVGFTIDVDQRLSQHNAGESIYTKDDRPWELILCMSFKDKSKAIAFEKYLKSGSGIAFANKRLR